MHVTPSSSVSLAAMGVFVLCSIYQVGAGERMRDMSVNGYTIEPRANLRGANLDGADLSGADLRGADLRGANLDGADLYGANLDGADLYGADLSGADLRGANLYGANLRGANLYGANLRVADLDGADLRGADLRGANLDGVGGVLSLTGIPSGSVVFVPTCVGWRISVGCWRNGTTAGLREMVARDCGWPEATGDEIIRRRPLLVALADMCDAFADAHQEWLDAVRKWEN